MTALFAWERVKSGPPCAQDIEEEKVKYCRETRGAFLFSLCSVGAILFAAEMGRSTYALSAFLPFVMSFAFGIYRVGTNPFAVVLDDETCAEIHGICFATDEARAYRERVLAQGREFVLGEYHMLAEWHRRMSRGPAYKRLYDNRQL